MSDHDYDYNYNGSASPGPGPGTPGPRPPRRDTDWGGVSWVLGMMLTFAVGPLGLFLTFAHAAGHDILGNLLQSIFGSRKKTARPASSARRSGTAKAKAKPREQKEEGRFDGVRHADTGAAAKTVFGWILVGFGIVAAISAAGGMGLWKVLSMVAVALGGGALVWSGVSGRKKEAKFRQCISITGEQGVVDMKKLAKTMGMRQDETERLLEEMVDRGFYGERAYIDHGRRLLVIDVEDMRDVYRREDEERARQKADEKAQAKEKMTEYERYVERIRQADEDIADEVMSEKIRRMQNLTASIFAEVQAHPEKRSQIDRFMNYYLPTTLKLLESYARIEAQGVSGENMAKAKADIEGIADTLVAGYERQLDKLYRAEAMDIAGDVGVIENMLKRDGLSDRSDFGQTAAGGH